MKVIPLTQGKVTIVDDEDFYYLNKFKWYALKHRLTFYAARNRRIYSGRGGQRIVRMHNEILTNIPTGMQCDHIDGNGLNNQKSNLRIVTPRENAQNLHIPKTSKYPGVSFNSRPGRKKRWIAKFNIGNTYQKTLGYFHTEEEAYACYCHECEKISKLHGVERYETNSSH